MAESIAPGCSDGQAKWHWHSVMHDLAEQGGLEGVTIDPLSVTDHLCGGTTRMGTKFAITWIHDTFLLLSMSQDEDALVEAFARVVEYRPFCRYICKESGLLTFEWDKQDPEGRFARLQQDRQPSLSRLC